MPKQIWLAAAAVGLGSSLISYAADKRLTRAQVPARVIESMDRESKGAKIKGYLTEREHGATVYEAETIVNGHTRDLQFASDGTLNEVEEEVALNTLPQRVREAIVTKARGAAIIKVESLTKRGSLVAYEASTTRNGHKGELQVGPTGEALNHEE